ncbi:MAG TPA: YbbR-like domain-containing protein [Bacteroidales bacterium]|jgi:YbbR domain-containing protein|nr:YbbR-like domain-containing protein [Bacteroidales bacterium]
MDLKASFREWRTKLKGFFSTGMWRNMLFFMLFMILAFIFWLMLFFQKENVEGTYRVPLKYTNVPEDVVFDNELPEFIEVTVADKGSEIFKLDVIRRDSLEIDVATLTEGGTTVLQGDQYRQLILSRLSPSSAIRGYYPMNISLATSKLKSKQLMVIFDGEITTSRANLVVDSVLFIPETITAYGSKESLDQLKNAVTEYTIFKNLKSTSQLPIRINPVEGVKFSPDQVEAFIPIEEYTERGFEVPIVATHLPKDLDVKFFPSKVNVTFSVTLEEYKKIDPEDFEITLDYRKFHDNEDGRVEIELTKSPSTVVNPRLSPTSVEFLFESKLP